MKDMSNEESKAGEIKCHQLNFRTTVITRASRKRSPNIKIRKFQIKLI